MQSAGLLRMGRHPALRPRELAAVAGPGCLPPMHAQASAPAACQHSSGSGWWRAHPQAGARGAGRDALAMPPGKPLPRNAGANSHHAPPPLPSIKRPAEIGDVDLKGMKMLKKMRILEEKGAEFASRPIKELKVFGGCLGGAPAAAAAAAAPSWQHPPASPCVASQQPPPSSAPEAAGVTAQQGRSACPPAHTVSSPPPPLPPSHCVFQQAATATSSTPVKAKAAAWRN